MSTNISERQWRTSLTSILEELDESEYKKMLFCSCFDKIPKSVKTGRSREEMPQIIIQHLGIEESISAINEAMEQIPRRDSAVQDLLRPFVDKLRNKHEEENKAAGPSTGAAGGNPMAKGKHFVDEHRTDLIQRVTNIEPILDELLGDVIQSEAYDNIRAQTTSQKKMRALYDALKAGEEAKDAFYKLLEKYEGCLVRDIKKKKKTKHT